MKKKPRLQNKIRKKKKKPVVRREPCSEHISFSETDVVRDLNEDFADAWPKLREFAAQLGDQRIYASQKAIMFARKTCYLFVRPNKRFLEICFF